MAPKASTLSPEQQRLCCPAGAPWFIGRERHCDRSGSPAGGHTVHLHGKLQLGRRLQEEFRLQ
jgi:hypothetical protein